jgi:hypothetical protein
MIRVLSGSTQVWLIVIFPEGSRSVEGAVMLCMPVYGVVPVHALSPPELIPLASTTPPAGESWFNAFSAWLTVAQKSALLQFGLQNAEASTKAGDGMSVEHAVADVHMAFSPSSVS